MNHLANISLYSEDHNWKDICKYLEQFLYEYPALKISIENELEWEKEGLSYHFPSLSSLWKEETSNQLPVSVSIEKYRMLRTAKRMKLRQMERALELLGTEEKVIIEEKYFNPVKLVDFVVYERLGLSKSTYHRIKKTALKKLAVALNMM